MPLFYYVLHIPLIHVAAIVVSLIRTGSITPWLFGNHPLEPPEQPPGYRWSLGLLYLVTAMCVVGALRRVPMVGRAEEDGVRPPCEPDRGGVRATTRRASGSSSPFGTRDLLIVTVLSVTPLVNAVSTAGWM